jgi:hypothetical protein
MEDLISEQTKDLMTGKENVQSQENQTFCMRFLRKKYKCVMLWMLSIIAFSQLLIIVLDKFIDEELVKLLSNKINQIFMYSNSSSNLV